MRCEAEWKEVVPRMGRWIDFDGGYKTMDASYMESVWWVFKVSAAPAAFCVTRRH